MHNHRSKHLYDAPRRTLPAQSGTPIKHTNRNIIQNNNRTHPNEEGWKQSCARQIIYLLDDLVEKRISATGGPHCPQKNGKIVVATTTNWIIRYAILGKKDRHTDPALTIKYQILQQIILALHKGAALHLQRYLHQHKSAIKLIVTLLEQARLALQKYHKKQKVNRIRWKIYDPLHDLGLLLILITKGDMLPRKSQNNIRKILDHMEPTVWTREPPGSAVVYYTFSSSIAADYVGQSKHFTTRMRREISDARKALNILKTNPIKHRLNKLQRTMARSGFESWYHLPIRILGACTSVRTRLRNETQLIAWLHPTINRPRNASAHIPSTQLQQARKSKPQHCKHKRRNHCPRCNDHRNKPLTTFTVASRDKPNRQTSGPDLFDLLSQFTSGCSLQIQKTNLYHDLTSYQHLIERYGLSRTPKREIPLQTSYTI
jgi:hypothetical protein